MNNTNQQLKANIAFQPIQERNTQIPAQRIDEYAQQQEIINRACSGDRGAKEEIVLQCLPAMRRYAWRFRGRLRHSEIGDLVSEAVVTILEHLTEALGKVNPIAWLVTIGRYRILDFIRLDDPLIHQTNWQQDEQRVLSLDAPLTTISARFHDLDASSTLRDYLETRLTEQKETCEQTYDALYTALSRLSPKRRQYLLERFGLQGYAETPLQEMAATRNDQKRIAKEISCAKKTLSHDPSLVAFVHQPHAELVA